jgi:hypothetical protein
MSQVATSVRERLIHRISLRLERLGAPRTQMVLIVIGTAAVGFLTSAGLLSLGFRVIWARYIVAVAAAYVGFLLLVRVWLWLAKDGVESDLSPDLSPEDAVDAADFALEVADPGSGGVSIDVDADLEGCLLVAAATMVLVLLAGAAGYFVLTAPTFLAEVLLDGALSVGLYRRVKKLHRRHWLHSAFRHTWFAFAGAAVLLGSLGVAMADYSPGADSIGDVWKTMRDGPRHPAPDEGASSPQASVRQGTRPVGANSLACRMAHQSSSRPEGRRHPPLRLREGSAESHRRDSGHRCGQPG